MNKEITIGRIIHVVLPHTGPVVGTYERPGIIVRTWGSESAVNVQVFTDGYNDGSGCPTIWKTSLAHDPTGQTPNTWHWPDEAKDEAKPAPSANA